MVARETTLPCSYCGVPYGLGERTGVLIPTYAKAESRYWKHCLTEAHQIVLRTRHAIIVDQLSRLPAVLAEARTAQREADDPQRQALKQLLA